MFRILVTYGPFILKLYLSLIFFTYLFFRAVVFLGICKGEIYMNKSLRRLIKVLILNIHEIFRNFVPRVALRPVPG